MSDLIDLLSIVFPLLSISFVFIITSINFYYKIRRKFPVTVNCWFCNVNTRVPYDDKNSWTCPTCEQYNGFTDDGDYNRDIPAQRNSKLNTGTLPAKRHQKHNASIISSASAASVALQSNNGLCVACNRNQEIKVQQLATFTPEYDNNYDEEIFEFNKKLEQAYRLCYRCERILNRTLNKVKQNVLGLKLSQIGTSEANSIFNMGNRQRVSAKRRVFTRLCYYLLIVLAVLNLVHIGRKIAIGKSQLDTVFSTQVTNGILMIISYISAVQHIFGMAIESIMSTKVVSVSLEHFTNMLNTGYLTIATFLLSLAFTDSIYSTTLTILKILQNDASFMLDFGGMVLSIVVLLLNGLKQNGSVIVWLLWSFKMAMPSMESRNVLNHDEAASETLCSLINVALSTAVFIISLLNTRNINGSSTKNLLSNDPNQSYHKIYSSNGNSDVSDESDDEFVEDILSTSCSSQRDTNFRSSPNTSSNTSSSKRSLHNTSLNTTKSFSPSMLQGPMASLLNSSFDTSQYSASKLQQRNNVFGGSQSSMLFDDCRSTFSGYSRSNALRSQDSLYSPKVSQNKQFSSMDNVIANDFQFGIRGLNINGNNEMIERPQPCYTLQPPFLSPSQSQHQLRQRSKQVVSPSRFGMNATILPTQQPLTQASWVAGGYWSGTSPQKKVFSPPQPVPPSIDLLPILSRTSSQSSGFESRASSVVNGGNGSGGDSEGSICGDASEQASVFSDTIRPQYSNYGGASQYNKNLNNSCSRSLFEQPKSVFPTNGNGIGQRSDLRMENCGFPTVYHQFGTQRAGFAPVPPSSPSLSFVSNTTSNNINDQSAFTFNKLTNNLPVIEKGSLLRDWKQRSMIDVSSQQ